MKTTSPFNNTFFQQATATVNDQLALTKTRTSAAMDACRQILEENLKSGERLMATATAPCQVPTIQSLSSSMHDYGKEMLDLATRIGSIGTKFWHDEGVRSGLIQA